MIEKIHEHMVLELQQNTKTDTIFIVVAVLLDFILLAVNSSIASEGTGHSINSRPAGNQDVNGYFHTCIHM